MIPGAVCRCARSAGESSTPEILYVRISTQPWIVCEIPANMVGVLVDNDLIAGPIPARNDVVIVRGDIPEETTKPEAFPVSAAEHENVLRAKSAAEASVRPRLIEVVMRIVGAAIMSHPLVVLGVDMRNIRMTLLVHGNMVFGGGRPASCRCRSARGRGTVGRNVPTPNRRWATAAAGLPASLRKRSHA